MLTNYNTENTIVALSTPPGSAGIGLIRMSGIRAIDIANTLCPEAKLQNAAGYSLHFGRLKDPETNVLIDEVIISLFRKPASFTGEDVVEISAHGSPYILSRIIELCVSNGARIAEPGEYTLRAYLNGKMDLAQAEAVADLIQAESLGAHQLAMNQMRGGFSNELNNLRDKLIEFASLLELELDFSEEDVEFADRNQFLQFVKKLKDKIQLLINSFRLGNAIKNGISVAIIGKPNAGKSSLLNALLNDDRAIVSDIPGTTRDTIEETLNIGGNIFRLIDTAGIRNHSTDPIEKMGIKRSRSNADKADIILYLIDMTNHEENEFPWLEEYQDKTIQIFNKWELWIAQIQQQDSQHIPEKGPTWINARNGEGVDNIRQLLAEKVTVDNLVASNSIVSNVRHYEALQTTINSLEEVEKGLNSGVSTDLIAIDLHQALHHLGSITGAIEVDRDILGSIFGKFCIGK